MSLPARVVLFLLFFLSPFGFLSSPALAANLLTNPGFEDGTSGWAAYPSTTTFEASSSARSGDYSALVTKDASKGYAHIYQEIAATPSAAYRFSGWSYFNDYAVKYVKLRLDWLGGDGKSLKETSEVKLEDRSSEFQKIVLAATAPSNAVKVKAEAFVYLDAANPASPVLFDDLSLEVVEPLSIAFELPESVTAGESFDVPVTVKNAEARGDYYAKALVGDSSGESFYDGKTYNPKLDDWLAWNGSWSKLPTFTTDGVGSASFTLRSKVKDDAPSGDYYFFVRIRKVGTGGNLDADPAVFFVNAAPATASSSGSTAPAIDFSVDDPDLKVNQSFDVNVGFKNAQPSHDYYVKIRLGLSASKLTKGRTYNSFYNAWLADNSAWANFPDLFTDSKGTWGSGIISAKVASGNPAGEYFIVVRLRDAKTGKNYDAAVKTIYLGEEDVSEGQSGEEDAAADVTDPGVVLGAFRELPRTGASTLLFGYLGSFLGLILRKYE